VEKITEEREGRRSIQGEKSPELGSSGAKGEKSTCHQKLQKANS